MYPQNITFLIIEVSLDFSAIPFKVWPPNISLFNLENQWPLGSLLSLKPIYLIKNTLKMFWVQTCHTATAMSTHWSAPETHFILERDINQAAKIHGYNWLIAENWGTLKRRVCQVSALLKDQQLHPQPIISTLPMAQLRHFTTDLCRDA